MNREVNLLKRVKMEDGGWLFWPVATNARGHIKPDVVLVREKEERHPEGAYYIEFRDNRKRIRTNVGNDAVEAEQHRETKAAELNAVANGVAVVPQAGANHVSLRAAIDHYLEEVKLTKKPKTLSAYSTALDYFAKSCHKLYVEEIDRTDLLKFAAYLRDEKSQSPRSVWNKFASVVSFLKASGIVKKNKRGVLTPAGINKNDWPQYTEEEPEIYEKDDLNRFFSACTDEERVWYEFFLMTGMREQECMYTYWSDVNLQHATVRVSHKPDRNWTPKAYRERTIPIPDKLVRSLKTSKAKSDGKCNLLFHTAGCKLKLDFLDCCKAIAKRAGLDQDSFWLHKFRATFATRHLWAGVDLRTVQNWMGHTDMESTMRYLKPQRGQHVREKVNGTWGD